MFLYDKYQVKNLSGAYFHNDIIKQIQKISQDDSMPNIIFYGCEGSGKHTLINLFLKYIYGNSIYNLEKFENEVSGSGTKTTTVVTKQSPYHIIIQPYNNSFDKYIIQSIVKSYAKRYLLDINAVHKQFKTVLINNIETLSYYAQMSLRRTMEKYTHTCRFVISCNSISKVIEPLKSRCICIRVPQPTDMEITQTVITLACLENKFLSLKQLCNILKFSKNNIKHAIMILDCFMRDIDLSDSYTTAITDITDLILKKTFDNSDAIKNIIYSILMTNISGTQIIKDIIINILTRTNIKLTDKQQYDIVKYGVKYEAALVEGRRTIIDLDGFINCVIICLIENEQIINNE